MKSFLSCAALLCCAAAASAQQRFVAPTSNSIIASSEQSFGPDQMHVFWVRNESTVPIVVFGINLSNCENVRQFCGGQKLHVVIPAGERRDVGRVQPKNPERSFNYRWSFSFHADSADAQAMQILRDNGFFGPQVSRQVAGTGSADSARAAMVRQMMREPPPSLPPRIRVATSTEPVDPRDTVTRGFRFKVAYGSIIGTSMMPGAKPQLTGPCVDPAEVAFFEKDKKITATPWRPPVMSAGFGQMRRPQELTDSTLKTQDVLVRFVTDTLGEAIPTSVSVLESPHGLVSIDACKAAISAHGTPAKDKAGVAIRAWVQVPMRVGR